MLDCGRLRRPPGRLPPNDWAPSLAAGMSFVSTATDATVVVVVAGDGEGLRPPPILRLPPRAAVTVEEGAAVEVVAGDVSGTVVVVEGSTVVELLIFNIKNGEC